MKRTKRRNKETGSNSLVIGIFGCGEKVGVTYLAIAMGTYLSDFWGLKTDIMECCGQDCLIQMDLAGNNQSDQLPDYFQKGQMRFYMKSEETTVAERIYGNQGAVVLDLGHDYQKARPYLMRCNRRILLGSTAPWRIQELIEFSRDFATYEQQVSWSATGALGGISNDKKKKRELPNLQAIPFLPNPFQVTYEACTIFSKLLKS